MTITAWLGMALIQGCRSPGAQGVPGDKSSIKEVSVTGQSILLDHQCAELFPLEQPVDLLGGETWSKFFFELPDRQSPNGGWTFKDHTLTTKVGGPFSHLVTHCSFKNFDLQFSWIITYGANSGVKYLVAPSIGPVGLEYQIVDDARHPDGRVGAHRQTGALYDLYAPGPDKTIDPPGTVNHSKIIYRNGVGEHWLNGHKILVFDRFSDDFQNRLKLSKFQNIKDFAKGPAGRILLQHHGDQVIFKKITIKTLP
jgi:hypothetical protein